MTALTAKIVAGLALLAALAVGFWAYHAHVYAQGAASRDAEVAAAQAQTAAAGGALTACSLATQDALKQADQQRDMAAAAVEHVESSAKVSDASLAKSIADFNAARKTPDCASAQVKLCPALLSY